MLAPQISLIITSYNQQEYLREAIESAIDQTVAAFEIIVADDHSTKDGSIETIREYAARYPGLVRGLFQEENVGIPKNRNSALRMVKGDHVAILDGDPMTPGKSFVARISCTAGSKVAPHTHPTTENVTIVKGTFRMGMGATWDDAKLQTLATGAFFSMPSGMTHFAQCQGDTVVQIHGIAPLRFDFK
jgi:glycosyltransferase involved in cell wall biosynthesis